MTQPADAHSKLTTASQRNFTASTTRGIPALHTADVGPVLLRHNSRIGIRHPLMKTLDWAHGSTCVGPSTAEHVESFPYVSIQAPSFGKIVCDALVLSGVTAGRH